MSWLCDLSGVARQTYFLQDKTAKTNLLFARQNCQDKFAFRKIFCQDNLPFSDLTRQAAGVRLLTLAGLPCCL